MDNTIPIEMTPDDAGKLSALIDQCLKVIKESNERSVERHAEMAQLQDETKRIMNDVRRMLDVETTL